VANDKGGMLLFTMLSYLMLQYSKSTNLHKLWSIVRHIVIKLLNDPLCTVEVHDWLLSMPLSHELPYYKYRYPQYDTLPRRLGEHVKQVDGQLRLIDVGANVGDSIAAFDPSLSSRILAVEPHPKFREHLERNWGNWPNITISDSICADKANKYYLLHHRGTATAIESIIGAQSTTLDSVARDFNCNILKIDTDGHDLEVILGGLELITKNKPIILFEFYSHDSGYGETWANVAHLLAQIGYRWLVVYNHIGEYVGGYPIDDANKIWDRYELDGKYMDILVVRDLVEFSQIQKQ